MWFTRVKTGSPRKIVSDGHSLEDLNYNVRWKSLDSKNPMQTRENKGACEGQIHNKRPVELESTWRFVV